MAFLTSHFSLKVRMNSSDPTALTQDLVDSLDSRTTKEVRKQARALILERFKVLADTGRSVNDADFQATMRLVRMTPHFQKLVKLRQQREKLVRQQRRTMSP